MRASLFALIFLAAGTLVGRCSAGEPRPFLIVAEAYPPYESLKDGRPQGINVDVVDHIFKKLKIPYEIKFYPWARAWLMIEKGKADAILSVSHEAARQPYLYYTPEQKAFTEHGSISGDYLWITEYVFFVNRKFENTFKFESYEQIKRDGYRVGTIAGYSYQPSFFKAELNTFPQAGLEQSFKQLVDGETDIFPMDKTVGLAKVSELGLADQITYLPKPLFAKPYLMGFSRTSDFPGMAQLMSNFYAELQDMRAGSAYRKIVEKHTAAIPRVPAVRPVLFVCEEWRPFEFMHDGKPAGLDVEVVDRIMTRLRIPYEIRIYPWSRAWLMVEKGSADAVLSVSYKQDREMALYYTDGQRAFAQTGKLPQHYLWLSEYVFFVKKKNRDRMHFESYEQVVEDGYIIGLNKDYSYNDAFLAHAEVFNTETYYDTKAGFTGLVQDEIDLYPMDKTVGLAELQNMGLLDSVVYLPKPLFTKPYLAPFVRNSEYPRLEAIMYDFYGALRDMRASGEYQAIYEQFISSLEPAADEPAAP